MKIKKIAIVGSRKMSQYGREMIFKLMEGLKEVEVATIRVSGCNAEIIKRGAKKIFEGNDFQKLNELLANYADKLVIIEGAKNSGTILLAQKFVEKGKEVYCLPGKINEENSWTPNWLISQGAIPLIDIDNLTGVLQ